MKKFLSHALPLCLALVICVCSLAVPAFAAEIDTCVIDGVWHVKPFDEANKPLVNYPIIVDLIVNGVHFDALNDGVTLTFVSNGEGYDRVLSYYNPDSPIDIVVNNPFTLTGVEYQLWKYCFERVDSVAILTDPNEDSIFSVFGGISAWLVSSIGSIMPMFYTEASGLTFIGTLAVAGLAFSVIFLVVAVIRRFLHFGG